VKVYRGWFVLFGLMLIYTASNGFLTNSLQIFYPVLIDEFGWDTTTVTAPAKLMFMVGAFTSPLAGILLDRYSTRHVMLVGLVAIVAALFAFSKLQNHGQMITIYIVFAIGLSLGGLGSNMLVLSRWHKAKLGLAAGLLLMCSSFGGAVLPKVLNYVMEQSDWRQALVVASIIAAVMMIVPILTLVRNKPSDLGLAIDGASLDAVNDTAANETDKTPVLKTGLTVFEALKQPKFYLLAAVTASLWFVIVGLLQHQPIYIQSDLGFTATSMTSFVSILFFCSMFGKLGFGVLSDYIDKHWSLIISAVIFAFGVYLFKQVELGQRNTLFLCAILIGVGFSGVFTNIQLLFASYYAGRDYGKILGLLIMLDSLGGAAGIGMVGKLRDGSGSYDSALQLMLMMLIFAIITVALLYWWARAQTRKLNYGGAV